MRLRQAELEQPHQDAERRRRRPLRAPLPRLDVPDLLARLLEQRCKTFTHLPQAPRVLVVQDTIGQQRVEVEGLGAVRRELRRERVVLRRPSLRRGTFGERARVVLARAWDLHGTKGHHI